MGAFCDRLTLGSTAALDCRTGKNKGRYRKKELLLLCTCLVGLNQKKSKNKVVVKVWRTKSLVHRDNLKLIHQYDSRYLLVDLFSVYQIWVERLAKKQKQKSTRMIKYGEILNGLQKCWESAKSLNWQLGIENIFYPKHKLLLNPTESGVYWKFF